MKQEGPQLETLTRRLAECPADFLAAPRTPDGSGEVVVAAVVSDLLRDLGGAPLVASTARQFSPQSKEVNRERNRLGAVLIACWLLHDPWFVSQRSLAPAALTFLAQGLDELARLIPAPSLVSDPDRREEMARLCLRDLGLRPAGETIAEAEDRLATLDSVQRARLLKETRAAEERARKAREELARKQAEEAAATYGRE